MTAYYMIRTDSGYLGRYSPREPLAANLPVAWAACFSSEEEAAQIARDHGGVAEPMPR